MIKILTVKSLSEKGIRDNNEDTLYPQSPTTDNHFFIVCDGMGGHENGEVASSAVSQSIADYLYSVSESIQAEDIQSALNFAIEKLNELDADSQERKMGTTVVLAVLNENEIIVAHAGDSRLYHIRPNKGILFQTKDHSKVQEWVDAEIITEEEARTHPKKNIITRCVQPYVSNLKLEINKIDNIQTGDYLFLCSDGVTDAITNEEFAGLISQDCSDSEKIENIKNICRAKSRDNYTAILISLEADLIPHSNDEEEKINEEKKHNCPSCGAVVNAGDNNPNDLEPKTIFSFTKNHFEKFKHKIGAKTQNICETCYVGKACAWIDKCINRLNK